MDMILQQGHAGKQASKNIGATTQEWGLSSPYRNDAITFWFAWFPL